MPRRAPRSGTYICVSGDSGPPYGCAPSPGGLGPARHGAEPLPARAEFPLRLPRQRGPALAVCCRRARNFGVCSTETRGFTQTKSRARARQCLISVACIKLDPSQGRSRYGAVRSFPNVRSNIVYVDTGPKGAAMRCHAVTKTLRLRVLRAQVQEKFAVKKHDDCEPLRHVRKSVHAMMQGLDSLSYDLDRWKQQVSSQYLPRKRDFHSTYCNL